MSANPNVAVPAPVEIGEACHRSVCFTRESIAEFARLTGDANPLHQDAPRAAPAAHGRIIASGQQSTSQMIGLAATYFSRCSQGLAREVLCLNFNFAFKAPVLADEPLALSWVVRSVEWHPRLGGWLAQADGQARAGERVCVVARGTLLVKAAANLV
jgi:acyl dehydratase